MKMAVLRTISRNCRLVYLHVLYVGARTPVCMCVCACVRAYVRLYVRVYVRARREETTGAGRGDDLVMKILTDRKRATEY